MSKHAPFALFFLFGRVNALSKDKETVIDIFAYKVDDHGSRLDQISVPHHIGTGQFLGPPRGKRREHSVKHRDLEHGDRHVVGGGEGVFAVESEVPKNAQNEGDKVRKPVRQMENFLKKRKGQNLYHSRAGGKQHEFHRAGKLLFCVAHSIAFLQR